ncbi:MAG TPA: hypothetical protein VFZ64_08760 [Nocardioidaceae bacterium]
MNDVLRAALRQVDPTWPYRVERAKRTDPASRKEPMGYARAPLAVAFATVGWQLAATAGVVGLTYLVRPGDLDGLRGALLLSCVFGTGVLFFLGAVAEAPVMLELARRRRWTYLLSGASTVVVLLRGMDHAFLPRRPVPETEAHHGTPQQSSRTS